MARAVRLELPISRAESWIGQRCAAPDICPTLTRTHDGFPAYPAGPGRHDREGVWPRWRASGDGGESPAQAAADRPAPCSPARAEPDAERPAAVWILVALPQSRTHPKSRHRPPPVDAPDVSSGVGTTQVPPPVLVDVGFEEAWPERAGPGAHPSDRRTQVAQSSVWLSTDCAHHLAHV